MRQYDDPVEVRRGEAEDPDQFLWRGRLWKVRAVVAHWVETGPWWQGVGHTDDRPSGDTSSAPGTASVLLADRELWRVEAGRGSASAAQESYGVFDLSFDWTDGRWQLVGCLD
jgi:hypothetical protein